MTNPDNMHATDDEFLYLNQAVTDVATAWDARVAQAIRRGSAIIALRGAGSTGGIDPEALDHVLDDELIPRIEDERRIGRPVAVMYDGDPDDRTKPDIGAVAGRLLDRFGPERYGVSFLTAQAADWYYPPSPGANLANANGLPYETFVFPRATYPGDHNRFTQSEQLARYPRYAQIYAGAAGEIATAQLIDYCRKTPADGPVNITAIRAMINTALSHDIGEKLRQADDDAKRDKLVRMQEQRQQIFGAHWDNDGEFDMTLVERLQQASDTHELVAMWTGPDRVDIINARRLDLSSPEVDAMFETADYYVKTTPIKARQVAPGHSETIIVRSGATRDIAQAGDWVCASAGTHEEYVVHTEDFDDIYEPDASDTGLFKPRYDPRKLVRITEDVTFMAPWGQKQTVRRGGYLMERTIRHGKRAGQTERYGISQQDAEPDFLPCGHP